LSERELEFVGVVSRRRDKSDGWRSIGDVQGSATYAAPRRTTRSAWCRPRTGSSSSAGEDDEPSSYALDCIWARHLTEGTIRAVPSRVFQSKDVG
jgi:hypothetical protein